MANAKKILVVDDDPDIVEQVTLILKQDGHEVHSAGTQNEAEEILLSFKPDLAIPIPVNYINLHTQTVPIPRGQSSMVTSDRDTHRCLGQPTKEKSRDDDA